jgi:hypothetical protein
MNGQCVKCVPNVSNHAKRLNIEDWIKSKQKHNTQVKIECAMWNKHIDGILGVSGSSNGIPRFLICVLGYGDHGKKFTRANVGNWVLLLLESWVECWRSAINVVGTLEVSRCVMGLVFEIAVTIESYWIHEKKTREIWSSKAHSTLGYFVSLLCSTKL